jgi:hypothetical protein
MRANKSCVAGFFVSLGKRTKPQLGLYLSAFSQLRCYQTSCRGLCRCTHKGNVVDLWICEPT